MKKTVFITGTDTGAGKTLLAGLLLLHLRSQGVKALAMKPFCCGSRSDVRFLNSLQSNELRLEEMNPFYFTEPVAPAVAAQQNGIHVTIPEALNAINAVKKRCEWLIVEGAGGLLVPVNEVDTIENLALKLKPLVLVAARNRLGAINQVLLTFYRLKQSGFRQIKVILMGTRVQNMASETNERMIKLYIGNENVMSIDYLGPQAKLPRNCNICVKKMKITLAAAIGGM